MRNTNSVAQIQACLLGTGSRFESQKEMLDDIIRTLLADGVPVSNKTTIIQIMRRIRMKRTVAGRKRCAYFLS